MIDKEQSKGLQLICQIKKDRVPGYPFYVVTTTYSQHDFHFLLAVDYSSDITLISIYPFKKDMTKLMTTALQLTDILSRKIVSTIHVTNFVFKPSNSSISVVILQLALGYRSGQLVIVQYKDKDWKIKHKLNRSIKNEGLFHRTTSAIFGGEECYHVYLEYPIRSFQREANQNIYKYSYQVGNCIIVCKQLDESNENKLLSLFDSIENKKLSEANNKKIVPNGDYFVYDCQQYSALFDPRSAICLLDFKNAISSYIIQPNRHELIVSSKETLVIIDIAQQFTLKATITTDMPIRSVQTFTFSKQVFLAILPYDNYLLIVSLARGSFIKLGGHKSYIASICVLQKQGKIVAAGMDHRISLISISKIKKDGWTAWTHKTQQQILIKESDKPYQKFEEVFSLGKASQSNIARNNLHSYGFGHCFGFQTCVAFCTYDYRIMIYDFNSSS